MAKLTLDEIKYEVDVIRQASADYESAHGFEDALHQRVLQSIASGKCDNPVTFARAALKTKKIDFPRFCA